jgi:hypothetical protein
MENRASSPDCHACIGLRASSLALIDQQQVPSANLELRTAGSELPLNLLSLSRIYMQC